MEEEGMTRKRLRAYQDNKEEIKELKHKLKHLGEGDSLIRNDVIFDYRNGRPRAEAIVGYDYDLEARRRTRYKNRIAKLEREQDLIEEWIFSIQDGKTSRIFQMYFLEGLTQEEVGKKVHLDRSVVSRKIDDFLNFAHKTQKTHL